MCSLFGFLDYQGIIPHKMLRKLTQELATAAEERGTDAAGISYVKDGKITIFKRPKPAHKLHFNPPEGTRALMGHTRLTTDLTFRQAAATSSGSVLTGPWSFTSRQMRDCTGKDNGTGSSYITLSSRTVQTRW